jgi:hypothetical protein
MSLDIDAEVQALEWRRLADGRRVLWVRPLVERLRAEAHGPRAAARLAAGCPVDEAALAGPLPDALVRRPLEWSLAADDAVKLVGGFAPSQLDDKWQIVAVRRAGVRVCFLRSWTGQLVYAVEMASDWRVEALWAPREDPFAPTTMRAVADAHLFGRTAVVPAPPEIGDDKTRLFYFGFGVLGRRCDAVEPTLRYFSSG